MEYLRPHGTCVAVGLPPDTDIKVGVSLSLLPVFFGYVAEDAVLSPGLLHRLLLQKTCWILRR